MTRPESPYQATPNGAVPPFKISGLGYPCDALGALTDHPLPHDQLGRWSDLIDLANLGANTLEGRTND